jgi:predicted nucleic acid-binding protein
VVVNEAVLDTSVFIARFFATLGQAGRRTEVNDLWIASTAATLGVPVVTQDDGFDVLAELGLVDVVRV